MGRKKISNLLEIYGERVSEKFLTGYKFSYNGLDISMSLILLYPVRLPSFYFPSVSDRWFGEGRGGAFRTTQTRRPCSRFRGC